MQILKGQKVEGNIQMTQFWATTVKMLLHRQIVESQNKAL
jgi:hypothetical protein